MKSLAPNFTEQRVIQRMKELRKSECTYDEIAALLNQNKVRTKSGLGVWHGSTVYQILNRPIP